jgi:hypothetical protein
MAGKGLIDRRAGNSEPTYQSHLDHVSARGQNAVRARATKSKDAARYDDEDIRRYVNTFGSPAEEDVVQHLGKPELDRIMSAGQKK